jgi:hypothetical protein
MGMSKQSMAELLAKLEKSGFVTREPSQDDKRVMIVKLTEKGKNASPADEAGDISEAEAMLDCLSEDELNAFHCYLGRIIKRYEDRFPGENYDERRKCMEEFMSFYGRGFGGPRPDFDSSEGIGSDFKSFGFGNGNFRFSHHYGKNGTFKYNGYFESGNHEDKP